MNFGQRNGLRLLVFPALEEVGLICAHSTTPLNVREEEGRQRLVAAVGLDPERAVWPVQRHLSEIVPVAGAWQGEADGLVTDRPGLPLLLRAADCTLIVVADPERRAVGVAHAGWKGSARGIVINLVRAMEEHYGSAPTDLMAGVGPTISQARYPVGPEVPATFVKVRSWANQYVRAVGGQLHFDLAGANTRFLVEAGVPRDQIDVCPLCTYDSEDILHSFRREGVGAGHHGLVAAWPERAR